MPNPTRRQLWPLLCAVAFVILLFLVANGWAPIRRADQAISEQFRDYGTTSPGVIAVTRVLTDVMSTNAFLVIGLAATIVLWRDRRRAALFCAVVAATVPVLWGLMHALLHRPRPVDGFVDIESNGFPSGHTAHAAATALTVVLLLRPRLASAAWATVVALAVTFAVAIGLSRVILLAHWPADVLGGWLLSLSVVPLLAHVFLGRTERATGSGEGAFPTSRSGSGDRPG